MEPEDVLRLRKITNDFKIWDLYIQVKHLMRTINRLTELEVHQLSSAKIMLAVDLLNTIEYYAPRIRESLTKGGLISKDRTDRYAYAYLEGLIEGHIYDEFNGYNPMTMLQNIMMDVKYDRIVDIGSGLGYWSTKISSLNEHQIPITYVEKREVIKLMEQLNMLPKLKCESILSEVPRHSNTLYIMANFLHLFTEQTAKDALKSINLGLDNWILVIEPQPDSTLSFSYDMQSQMKIMKGIESCYSRLPEIISTYKSRYRCDQYYRFWLIGG